MSGRRARTSRQLARQLARFSAGSALLAAASDAPVTVDTAARTLSGLLVPFGKVGATSAGRVTFAAGSITVPTDVSRVKLLVEHDQGRPIGYATELRETPEGIVGTFHVPEGDPDGDQALAKASNRVRDGLSVGVQLDDATLRQLRRADGGAVAGKGQLRETSTVSVPAFDDARVSAVAHTDLVVSAWADHTPTTPEDPDMTPQQLAALLALAGIRAGAITGEAAQALTTAATDTTTPLTVDRAAQLLASAGVQSDQVDARLVTMLTAAAAAAVPGPTTTPPGTPAATPAAAPMATAGAAQVTGEPSVYTFSAGSEHSLVRDAYAARMAGSGEAAERLARFNQQLTDGNAPSVMALAAVATTTGADEQLDPAGFVLRPTYRPDLMRAAINRGRPIIDRLNTITISNATPFAIPSEGEFSGVGDHTEGTAHVPEGTLTMGSGMVTPRAVSGAYRISRELVDAYNPALDVIALRAMLRDYRRVSEGKAAALFNALTADETLAGPLTAIDVRAQLIAFAPEDDDVAPDWILSGRTALEQLLTQVLPDGRPALAMTAAPGSAGAARPGYTGLGVDGVAIGKASRLTPGRTVMAEADAVVWAESAVQTFRYDEVEGPGILKLALWAYVGGGIYDRAGVRVVDSTPAAG